jgi:hypothetical protein
MVVHLCLLIIPMTRRHWFASFLLAIVTSACTADVEAEVGSAEAAQLGAATGASEDLFHPTGAPDVTIPTTFENLKQWELFYATAGVTIIGRSYTSKAKVVVVYLPGEHRDLRGIGYSVASDFHVSVDPKAELSAILDGITKDLSAELPRARRVAENTKEANEPENSQEWASCKLNWPRTAVTAASVIKDGAKAVFCALGRQACTFDSMASLVQAVTVLSYAKDLICEREMGTPATRAK